VAGVLVVNASPLILLSRIGRLDLLPALGGAVVVPQSVLSELEAGNHVDGAADAVRANSALVVVPDVGVPASLLAWDLGAGETQVLSHCLERVGALAVLDDRAARRCAEAFELARLGTLGVVVRAKRQGLVRKARPLLEALMSHGLRLKPEFVRAVLQKVGE